MRFPSTPRRERQWLLDALVLLLAVPGFTYLLYQFVSVVLLGESSACPQNLCQ